MHVITKPALKKLTNTLSSSKLREMKTLAKGTKWVKTLCRLWMVVHYVERKIRLCSIGFFFFKFVLPKQQNNPIWIKEEKERDSYVKYLVLKSSVLTIISSSFIEDIFAKSHSSKTFDLIPEINETRRNVASKIGQHNVYKPLQSTNTKASKPMEKDNLPFQCNTWKPLYIDAVSIVSANWGCHLILHTPPPISQTASGRDLWRSSHIITCSL